MKTSRRLRVRSAHAVAGGSALVLALAFLAASITVELFGSHGAVMTVKRGILLAVPLLAVSAMVAGGSGTWLASKSKAQVITRKALRMRVIGGNAVLVLIPCAVVLDRMATAAEFGTRFAVVQAIELVFGAVNVTLLGLNMRDGLRMRARRSRATRRRRFRTSSPVRISR
jgi:hypothetical protein